MSTQWLDPDGRERLAGSIKPAPGTLGSVTDGSTTVSPASSLDFTSGATVTNGGAGVAQVAIAGGTSPVRSATKTITPALMNAANTAAIPLTPAVGASEMIVDAVVVFRTPAVFTAYGGVFNTSLAFGNADPAVSAANALYSTLDIAQLTAALTGATGDDIVIVWLAGVSAVAPGTGAQWNGPPSLAPSMRAWLVTSAAPTGGAGDISAVTTYTVGAIPA